MNCRLHLHELKADTFMNCPAGMGCAPVARDMNGCAVVICASRMRAICLLRKRDMHLRCVKVSQGDRIDNALSPTRLRPEPPPRGSQIAVSALPTDFVGADSISARLWERRDRVRKHKRRDFR